MHSSSDGAAYRTELADDGHTIITIMLADYQDYPNGGNGYMRFLRFSPADNTIYVTTYSPYIDAYITTSPDQMEIDYDMAGYPPFESIETVSGVANGENASITWPDLSPDSEYEWYVNVSDGVKDTNGPVWEFTTAAGPDFDVDCDVDGKDLATLISYPLVMDISVFAGAFGSVCP